MTPSETYHELIDTIVSTFGASHAIMHVHVGLAIYLSVQLLVRTRRGSMAALHVIFLLEMANEVLDWLYRGSLDWRDTFSDIGLTMMWPVAITLVSQYRRARWEKLHHRAEQYRAAAHRLLASGSDAPQHLHWVAEGTQPLAGSAAFSAATRGTHKPNNTDKR